MPPLLDLTGHTFGGWTVLAPAGKVGVRGVRAWLCRCECGKEQVVLAHNLRGGVSKRCRSCANRNTRKRQAINAEAVVTLLLTGETPAAVAQSFGVTVDTIYKIARARGVPLPESPVRRRVRILLAEGRSTREMASEIGVTAATIRSHVRAIEEEQTP